jgi:uncharacterized protein with HEPN domain
MFNGRVGFRAPLNGRRIEFESTRVSPPLPSIAGVDLASDGDAIALAVDVAAVADTAIGVQVAQDAANFVLNRLALDHCSAIGTPRITSSEFQPTDPQPNTLCAGTGYYHLCVHAPTVKRGVSQDALRATLERAVDSLDGFGGMFRSALSSAGPVEEFMHLYNLLLMRHGEKQKAVDDFVRAQNPGVASSQSPQGNYLETIYTRLRNEVAHSRPGVNLDVTKAEMTSELPSLRSMVRASLA